MTGATLDSGALIAFERAKRKAVTLITRALHHGDRLAVPAGAVAQVWRDGSKQARLARLLASDLVDVVPLDDPTARAVGQLSGVTGSYDAVDVSVILCARYRDHPILTSDLKDLRRIDPRVELVKV
jgi:hypothetical protein